MAELAGVVVHVSFESVERIGAFGEGCRFVPEAKKEIVV
jgi:hypothetical protein